MIFGGLPAEASVTEVPNSTAIRPLDDSRRCLHAVIRLWLCLRLHACHGSREILQQFWAKHSNSVRVLQADEGRVFSGKLPCNSELDCNARFLDAVSSRRFCAATFWARLTSLDLTISLLYRSKRSGTVFHAITCYKFVSGSRKFTANPLTGHATRPAKAAGG